jgi:hypothetical protein
MHFSTLNVKRKSIPLHFQYYVFSFRNHEKIAFPEFFIFSREIWSISMFTVLCIKLLENSMFGMVDHKTGWYYYWLSGRYISRGVGKINILLFILLWNISNYWMQIKKSQYSRKWKSRIPAETELWSMFVRE